MLFFPSSVSHPPGAHGVDSDEVGAPPGWDAQLPDTEPSPRNSKEVN